MLAMVELQAGFFLIGADGAFGQRAGAGILPQGLECFLHVAHFHVGMQRDLAVHMNLKRGVVMCHRISLQIVLSTGGRATGHRRAIKPPDVVQVYRSLPRRVCRCAHRPKH